MKQFAFYLPQFHEIKENNEWWGDGFTEWTNVKKAIPLYHGHVQPKKPLGDNYYNLLNKETVVWQNNLMKKYGIYGMIYYHYYFEGKLLLEKPAENLLRWKDIKQPFFFCWANHTWNRSWNGTREVLVQQTYGKKDSWEKHFEYLLPFFKDERYEKIDNKPVFMIFDSAFDEKHEMFDFLNKKCIENGFSGIYVIESYKAEKWPDDLIRFKKNKSNQTYKIFFRESSAASAIYKKQIKYTLKWLYMRIQDGFVKRGKFLSVKRFDGNTLYKIMTDVEPHSNEYVHGVFFEWDNTPRHSKRGFVINPPSKETYFKFMNSCKGEDYLFINAWNEWAEGMVLEPTAENGYKYLEWIKEWLEENDI